MTLFLVRHGQAETGLDSLDPGLAPIGHEQATLTAEHFARRGGVARLVVSPLRRTRETVAPIAARLDIEPEVRREVAEVFDPTMPIEERRNMIGPFMEGRWSEQSEGLRAWRQRVIDTLVGLADGPQDVVVVSHYIAIDAAIGQGLGDDRVVPVAIAHTSITSIEVEAGRLQLVAAAETPHLGSEWVTGLGQAMAGGEAGQ